MARIEEINALAELERVGWPVEPLGASEVRVKCPSHDDSSPSASLNTEKNVWTCHACHASGDIVSLLALAIGTERKIVLAELSTRYELGIVKTLSPRLVEEYHKAVWASGPLLKALHDRGVTDEMIRVARIGYYDGRLTIPVYDETGRVINIRRYLPGAPTQKMKNTKGFGGPMLYQVDHLDKFSSVWVCGGELKALVVGQLLKEHDVGAVSSASGEGSWESVWDAKFIGKRVWICMDIDGAGRRAARIIAKHLIKTAERVHIIHLPLDPKRYPKGDISDFVGKEGAGTDELMRLMLSATEFKPGEESAATEIILGPPKRVTLASASHPIHVRARIEFEAVISALDTTPYLVPKEVKVNCTRDQNNCHMCPISSITPDPVTGIAEATIPSTSPAILDIVNCGKTSQSVAISEGLRMPECKAVEFNVKTYYSVSDARLVPKLEISGEGANNVVQPALIVGERLEPNYPYLFCGTTHPHPRTQQAALVLDSAVESQDSLNTFQPSEQEIDELKSFQPDSWTLPSLTAKLDAIYDDLEANVTGVFSRRELHLAYDLAYHSVLFVPLDGDVINGWTNVVVVGDSSQGKTETSTRLMKHYGLGERVECKNATVPGLLGGVAQLGNRWFVSWGVIPMHDRRLVILEELNGASIEVIGKLTDMRSSGVAEIPKIERRRAHARTRIIAIGNPRNQRSMASYGFGIEALHELVGGLQDLRRFDIGLVVTASQVNASVINRLRHERPKVRHTYTSSLCRRLILWAWTVKPADITVTVDARRAIAASAEKLCAQFDESLPLVDAGSIQHKITRLSTALAARTFSFEDGRLVVHGCHVEYIIGLLQRIYSAKEFGYADYSAARRRMNTMSDAALVRKYLLSTRHPGDFVHQLLQADTITLQDLQDWTEADRDAAQSHMSYLVRKHALRRKDRSVYVKTPSFIELLRRMEEEGLPEELHQEDEM